MIRIDPKVAVLLLNMLIVVVGCYFYVAYYALTFIFGFMNYSLVVKLLNVTYLFEYMS